MFQRAVLSGLVSCLSVPCLHRAREGSYIFSTLILVICSCSKKCSKSSCPHFLNAGGKKCVASTLQPVPYMPFLLVHFSCLHFERGAARARGAVAASAPHAEGPGLNPKCVHALTCRLCRMWMLAGSILILPPPPQAMFQRAVLSGLVSCLSVPCLHGPGRADTLENAGRDD